jgi:hypothetical protein
MIDYFAQAALTGPSAEKNYPGRQSAAFLAAHDPLIMGYTQTQCETEALCTEMPGANCQWRNGTCLSLTIRCENFVHCGPRGSDSHTGCAYTVDAPPRACTDANGSPPRCPLP